MLLFSFVIPTYGRTSQLERCLASIAAETERDFEVLVVDQNPGDAVEEIVRRFSGRLPVRHLRQPFPGASAARNFGASQADGEWLGFPDDDCRFLPGTFAALRQVTQSGDADLFTGETVDESGSPSVLLWPEREMPIDKQSIRATLAESTLYVRREVFWSVGGFDPLFGPGSRFAAEEGVDFVRRLERRSGERVRMRFYPWLRFFHAHAPAEWDRARLLRERRYAAARGASAARHWRLISYRRASVEIVKHLAGSLVLRGGRRRSRYVTLLGYLGGFLKYHGLDRHEARKIDAAELHLTRG